MKYYRLKLGTNKHSPKYCQPLMARFLLVWFIGARVCKVSLSPKWMDIRKCIAKGGGITGSGELGRVWINLVPTKNKMDGIHT
jgi:hypothetical protein